MYVHKELIDLAYDCKDNWIYKFNKKERNIVFFSLTQMNDLKKRKSEYTK